MKLADNQPHADPLLIVGGGISGLTAALSLAEAGFHIHIFEQAETLTETGAGLQLSPNATRVLRDLGVLEKLGEAKRPDSLRIYSGTRGTLITEMPLGDAAEKRWGAPTLALRRSDLQQTLATMCAANPHIMLHLGCTITGFDASHGITLQYQKSGAEKIHRGCALIGADGLHSRIRAGLLHDGVPHYTGYAAYRAMLSPDALPPELAGNSTILWLAHGLHVVHYRLSKDCINLVAVIREGNAHDDGALSPSDSISCAAADCSPILQNILRAPQTWTRWPLFDRETDISGWPHCPITLLGDAAHPMLPFLAQGAAQAIEDAAVLTHCLIEEPQYPADAFATYRAQRARHIAKIQNAAVQNGKVFHFKGLRATARDTVLKLMGGKRMMALYDWVYKRRS